MKCSELISSLAGTSGTTKDVLSWMSNNTRWHTSASLLPSSGTPLILPHPRIVQMNRRFSMLEWVVRVITRTISYHQCLIRNLQVELHCHYSAVSLVGICSRLIGINGLVYTRRNSMQSPRSKPLTFKSYSFFVFISSFFADIVESLSDVSWTPAPKCFCVYSTMNVVLNCWSRMACVSVLWFWSLLGEIYTGNIMDVRVGFVMSAYKLRGAFLTRIDLFVSRTSCRFFPKFDRQIDCCCYPQCFSLCVDM